MTVGAAKTSKGPFKDKNKLIASIKGFLSKNSAAISGQGAKISEFFEMCCYNDVVEFYEKSSFSVSPQQLGKAGEFVYKLKANGSHENFSFFEVEKTDKSGVAWKFHVHHNLQLECALQTGIFYTADIAVVTAGSVKREKVAVYNQQRSYCPANSVQTFFEVKHMGPFPELLFSFTGLVMNFFVAAGRVKGVKHIAPSLLISGNPNLHAKTISAFVAAQYQANVLAHLFVRPSTIYSTQYSKLFVNSLR